MQCHPEAARNVPHYAIENGGHLSIRQRVRSPELCMEVRSVVRNIAKRIIHLVKQHCVFDSDIRQGHTTMLAKRHRPIAAERATRVNAYGQRVNRHKVFKTCECRRKKNHRPGTPRSEGPARPGYVSKLQRLTRQNGITGIGFSASSQLACTANWMAIFVERNVFTSPPSFAPLLFSALTERV